MQANTLDDPWREDRAPRQVLEIFATHGTSMVLHTLHARHEGRARSSVLHRSLPCVSKKMLTQTLRDMEASRLIMRIVYGNVPPSVDCALTPFGSQLVQPIELIYAWARQDADALDALRPRLTSRRRPANQPIKDTSDQSSKQTMASSKGSSPSSTTRR